MFQFCESQMESSFLEDFLKREVDQNQVNALVGSFENQLTTPRNCIAPAKSVTSIAPGQTTSLSQLVSQSVPRAGSTPGKSIQNVVNRNVSAIVGSQINGKVTYTTEISKIQSNSSPRSNIVTTALRPSTPTSRQISSSPRMMTPNRQVSNSPRQIITPNRPTSGLSMASPQVSIAPKITSTVPIAPRLGANIMITPRQAHLLMAQRFGHNAALIQNNVLTGIPGGIQVIPRVVQPGGVTIAVPPVMNTQIPPGIRTLTARTPNVVNMLQKPDIRMRMNSPLAATSLTQIKTSNSVIPGQINYRFRQVGPSQVNPANTTSAPATIVNGASQANSAANITMMKESVKRLKEFFQNLINLACGPNQPPEIGKLVKELVHNLMQGRVSEEEFIEKLQKTLKSDPQPNLVHFLKKTLPHLRETIRKQQTLQMNPKSQAQPMSISNRNQVRATLPSVNQHLRTSANNLPHITPQQLIANKNLSAQEQLMLQKQLAQHGRIVVASAGQATPGMKTFLPGAMHNQAASRMGMNKQIPGMAAAGAPKEKPRNTQYSSAVGGDEDFIDVTCMAGVNLMEESQKILATGADFMSYQTRSVKDSPILVMDKLKKLVEQKAQTFGIKDIGNSVLTVISHATEERLRNLIERLTACSLHRSDPHKDDVRYDTISDVRKQLRVFEEIDEVERKHRETREREMLMRVAKSRSRTEDPEQARLKEKAKQMQMEEEEINRKRAANRTALEAIGGPKKKRKLDEALESLQNDKTPVNNSATPTSTANTTPTTQNVRTRQHRITTKDLTFVLESERDTCKSLVLYRSYTR